MKRFALFSIVVLFFASCQRVISIDLNSSDPQYIIEASLFAGKNDFSVQISQTSNYFGTDKPKQVTNAVVILSKSDNSLGVSLVNMGAGKYVAKNYSAFSNTEYKLVVNVDGKTFEATSFLNPVVQLDSVKATPEIGFLKNVDPDSFQINCFFNDPPKIQNYYRIETSINGKSTNADADNILVVDDRLSDGITFNFPIFTSSFTLNDTVEVQLLSIDKKMYDYFNTLRLIVGQSSTGNAAPTNPNSNWSNGALGYFGAFSSSKRTIVVR